VIISLIGYRATGKTTVGSMLAESLGWHWVDTDVEIQRVAGMSIRAIFDNFGEAKFREMESQVIRDLLRRHKLVLSLGGGAILAEDNRLAIKTAGAVVWLTAPLVTIRHRLNSDPATLEQRPALTQAGAADEIETVLAERKPLYEDCADLTLSTETLTPKQLVDEIVEFLDPK